MSDFIFKSRKIWFVTMLMSCLFVSAYDFTVDGIFYNVIDLAKLECEVTKGDEPYISLNIPPNVNFNNRTFRVKRIGESACEGCYNLRRVNIPNSVESIGDKAFSYCSNALKTITIPDSVLSIGAQAFEYCKALNEVTIGDAVTDIGLGAFSDCVSLKEITIGKSVKNIGAGAFSDCKSIESIILPNKVVTLGESAFLMCRSLSKVILSENLKALEYGTFYGCEKLKEIHIPGSVDCIVGSVTGKIGGTFSNLKILYLDYSKKELACGGMYYDVFFLGKRKEGDIVVTDGINWTWSLEEVFFDRQMKVNMDLPRVVKLSFGKHLKTVQINDIQNSEKLQTIICYSQEPPILPECSNKQYLNVVVKVPQEALEKYQQAPVWKNFMNLEGYDSSERDNI